MTPEYIPLPESAAIANEALTPFERLSFMYLFIGEEAVKGMEEE